MLVDLPPGRVPWAHVVEVSCRVECDPRYAESPFSRQDSTLLFAIKSKDSLKPQPEARYYASGPEGLRVPDLSAFGRADVTVIIAEALVQAVYHILEKPHETLSLLDPGTFHRYLSWLDQYCQTHYVHFLHTELSPKATMNLASSFQYRTPPSSLQGQSLLECQHGAMDYILTSPMQMSGTSIKKEDRSKWDSSLFCLRAMKISPTQQPTTSCTHHKPPTAFFRYSSNRDQITEPYIVLSHCRGNPPNSKSDKVTLEQSLSPFAHAGYSSRQRLNRIRYMAASGRPTVDLPECCAGIRARASDGEANPRQTGSGSEQGRGKHKETVQQTRRHSTWPSVVGQKRAAIQEDSSDDDDKKESGKGTLTLKRSHNAKLRFACPFFKHNPNRFASSRSCCGPGWRTVHRVKEHIFRSHKAPDHECPRCLLSFKDPQTLKDHCRAERTCKVQQRHASSCVVDESTMRILKQRGKTTGTEEEKWYNIYAIIFPGDIAVSSPYYDLKEKEPALPSTAVAKEMFRERLRALLPTMDLDNQISRDLKDPKGVDRVMAIAMAAFDDTFSAMKREHSPQLDDAPSSETVQIPELEDLEIPGILYGNWLSPLMDPQGQTSETGKVIELESDGLLKPALQQGSTAVDMEGYKLGLPEGADSESPSTNALAAPVSEGQTGYPNSIRVWRIPPPSSVFDTEYWTPQHQTQQQQQSQPKRRRLLPVLRGYNPLVHESSSVPAGESSGSTSSIHSLQVDTRFTSNPPRMDERPTVEDVAHDYWFNDYRRDWTKAKNGGPRRESLPDIDAQRFWTMQDYNSYDPEMPNTWHEGIGSLSWTDHQIGNLSRMADDYPSDGNAMPNTSLGK